jgi:hypothetical protein
MLEIVDMQPRAEIVFGDMRRAVPEERIQREEWIQRRSFTTTVRPLMCTRNTDILSGQASGSHVHFQSLW